MRNKLLQLVHIGKNQLGMDDETYRSLLSQQFYQNSAKNISYSQLVELVKLLQKRGAKIRLPRGYSGLSPVQRKLWAIWKSMEADGLIEDSSSDALNSYARRLCPRIDDWQALNKEEASLVIETLKQWKKRVGK